MRRSSSLCRWTITPAEQKEAPAQERTWRSGNRVIRGRWVPRRDGPGIVVLKGERGTNWTLWNNSTRSSARIFNADRIRLSSPVYSWIAFRIAPGTR